MDIDIDASLRALEAGIGLLPYAIIVMALLGGPTAIWLLYRYFVQPRTSRYRASPMGPIWICMGCQSANELASSRCYRCHRKFDEARIGLIDRGPGELITVHLSSIAPAPEPPHRLAKPRPDIAAGRRDPVAVGAGRPDVHRPRRVVAVGPGRPDVDRPRRAVATGRSAPKASGPKGSGPKPRDKGQTFIEPA